MMVCAVAALCAFSNLHLEASATLNLYLTLRSAQVISLEYKDGAVQVLAYTTGDANAQRIERRVPNLTAVAYRGVGLEIDTATELALH